MAPLIELIEIVFTEIWEKIINKIPIKKTLILYDLKLKL